METTKTSRSMQCRLCRRRLVTGTGKRHRVVSGALQNEREMGICASCEAMVAEPDPTRRRGYGALMAVCVEGAPVGRRCIRMRCLECGKEWLKIEPTKGLWAVCWMEG